MAEHREYLLRTRSRTLLRTRHRMVTLGTVTALSGVLGVLPTVVMPEAAHADSVPCGTQTEGCLVDRYDDPTTDFGNLDDGNLTGAAATSTDSTHYSAKRTVSTGVGINFRGLDAWPVGGAAGIDIAMFQQGLNLGPSGSPMAYVPCKNVNDSFHRACQNPSVPGYYASRAFSSGTTNPYPVGVLIPNSTSNSSCTPTCNHYWANRLFSVEMEFYPKPNGKDTDPNYVRPRFGVRTFSASAGGNGWNMSADWGTVPSRYITDPNVARLQGNVYRTTGIPDIEQRLRFSVFQNGSVSHAVTSTGRALYAFAVGADDITGRYSTGALYSAVYDITVRDTANNRTCRLATRSFTTLNVVLNFTLDQPRFGLSPHMLGVTCNF